MPLNLLGRHLHREVGAVVCFRSPHVRVARLATKIANTFRFQFSHFGFLRAASAPVGRLATALEPLDNLQRSRCALMLIESSGISPIIPDREMWRFLFRSEKCPITVGIALDCALERNSVPLHGGLKVSERSP